MNEKLIAIAAVAVLALELYWIWLTEPLGKFILVVLGLAVLFLWIPAWNKVFDAAANAGRQQRERCSQGERKYCTSPN